MWSDSENPVRAVVPGMHGSSLVGHGDTLDLERASSMADEGGAAGAEMDTFEQQSGIRLAPRAAPGFRALWLWGAVAAGAALLALGWFRRSR